MKRNLTQTNTFCSTFSSRQQKIQGLKIREKKLQTKYKILMQKHNTLNKFTKNNLDDINLQELDENKGGNFLTQQVEEQLIKQAGRVTSFYGTQDKKKEQQEVRTKKPYHFLTARNLLEKSRDKNESVQKVKSKTIRQKLTETANLMQDAIDSNNKIFLEQNHTQLSFSLSLQCQDFQTKQFINKLDTQASCYSRLWQKFLKQVKQIQKNQEQLCLAHVCEKDRKFKLVENFMKEMEFLLEQHDQYIIETMDKLQEIRENQLKKLYISSHQLHERHMHAKTAINQHNLQYQQYLFRLKQQEKQRRQMLQSKRQFSLNKSQLNSRSNSPLSPLRYLHQDRSINEKDIKQMMEKKSKLNLQLDLNFQIQQRKRIAKEKQVLNDKKAKLERDKSYIQNRMKQMKQKIEFKEKETERYEFQKEKYQKERQYFLKMLLKNPDYRLDGAMWTFKKMIEYGHEPRLSDFSQMLDLTAKTFLMNEFQLMKNQHIYEPQPLQGRKHRLLKSKKGKRPANRQRVKSVIVPGEERQNESVSYFNIDDLNSNLPPNLNDKNFFTFGSKNLTLKQPEANPSIRKKSGSLTMMKTYDESLGQTEQNSSRFNNKHNSFNSLLKENNRNKLYLSAQKYIKNWVSQQGWNVCTSRSLKKTESHRKEDDFISEEKTRVKQKYFKIGRPNTRYNSIVKTLYGSEEDLKTSTALRVKTSRQ